MPTLLAALRNATKQQHIWRRSDIAASRRKRRRLLAHQLLRAELGEPAIGPKKGTLRSTAAFMTAVEGPPSIDPKRMNTFSCSTSARALASALLPLLSSSTVLSTIWRPCTPPCSLAIFR